MKIHFNISEFLVDPNMTEVPVHVADKIVKYHIPVLNPIRIKLDSPVFISKHSGYRSTQWEIDDGRDGSSQHTFGDSIQDFIERDKHWGAVDVTAIDLNGLLEELKTSDYKRVCYYPKKGFIHCDYKGEEYTYHIDEGSGWKLQGYRK
ncbi:MAG: D-Ala-D-Ala carboxypeptidase family metallohydrolase [Balneola sp.]